MDNGPGDKPKRKRARVAERPGYVTLDVAASMLDCSRWTVKRWLERRGSSVIRYFPGDPRGFVSRAEVDALALAGESRPRVRIA